MGIEYGVATGSDLIQTRPIGSLPSAQLYQQRYAGSIRVRRDGGPWQPYESDDPAWPTGAMQPTVLSSGWNRRAWLLFIPAAITALLLIIAILT